MNRSVQASGRKETDAREQRQFSKQLDRARELSRNVPDHHIEWIADPGENLKHAKSMFEKVAKRKGLVLHLKRLRGRRGFRMVIHEPEDLAPLDVSAYHNKIMEVLNRAAEPLSRSRIVEEGNLDDVHWNIRIKELVNAGKVIKSGNRRSTVYYLSQEVEEA
jgi:hypothetical protein